MSLRFCLFPRQVYACLTCQPMTKDAVISPARSKALAASSPTKVNYTIKWFILTNSDRCMPACSKALVARSPHKGEPFCSCKTHMDNNTKPSKSMPVLQSACRQRVHEGEKPVHRFEMLAGSLEKPSSCKSLGLFSAFIFSMPTKVSRSAYVQGCALGCIWLSCGSAYEIPG